jgi:hypothetical protein
LIVFKFSHTSINKYLKFKNSKSALSFSLASVVAELLAISQFSINLNAEPMLPPGGRNWQLINGRESTVNGALDGSTYLG